jgi:flagellar hook-length control protein FliK
MNPMILKIASSLINRTIDNKKSSLKSTNGGEDFFSIIQKSLGSGKKPIHTSSGLSKEGVLPGKRGNNDYLESLRNGLIAKGIPLSKVFLKRKDLPLVKNILYHCGFSHEKVELFIKDLVEDNPSEEFNLASLFIKINELLPTKKTQNHNATLEPSLIPHIELILRKFGLTPKELDHALSAARGESGDLDLNQFVKKLKEISKQTNRGDQTTIDKKLIQNISNKLEGSTVLEPDKGLGRQISLKDFIGALEQISTGFGKEDKLPPEVKTCINQIIDRAVLSDGKHIPGEKLTAKVNPIERESMLFPLEENVNTAQKEAVLNFLEKKVGSFQKETVRSFLEENVNTAEKETVLSSLKKKAGPVEKETVLSSKNGKENPLENKRLLSSLNERKSISNNAGHQNTQNSNKIRKIDPPSKLDGGQGLNGGAKEEGYVIKPETLAVNLTNNATGSTFSEAIGTGKENEKPFRDFLPGYLVDQVGKQISRSILRGDKIIKLRLKPPELGVVKVEMDIQDNVLKLGMIIENNSVKELLLSNVQELRNALIEQGVKLERLDVQINYDFNQSLADSKEWLKQEKGWGQDLNGEPSTTEHNTKNPQSEPGEMIKENYLLDLVA